MPRLRNSIPKIRLIISFSLVALLSSSCRFAGVCTSSAEECQREEAQWNGESTTGDCTNGALKGRWGINDSYITFKSDCSFVSNRCTSITGSYAYTSSATLLDFDLSTSSDTTLCPLANYTCTVSKSGTLLTLTCSKASDATATKIIFTDYTFQTATVD